MTKDNTCSALADLEPAIGCAELDNRGGIVSEMLVGFMDDMLACGGMPYSPVRSLSLKDNGTLASPPIWKAGTRPYRLSFTDETGTFSITPQGEAGGESYLYQLDIIRAKMGAEIFGFENALRGRDLVIIVKDKNGTRYLMGDSRTPARMVSTDASTTGTAVTDRNQSVLRFQFSSPRKLVIGDDPIYEDLEVHTEEYIDDGILYMEANGECRVYCKSAQRGAYTFSSSDSDVATIADTANYGSSSEAAAATSAEAVITSVAAGTCTITIKKEYANLESSTTKTIQVNVSSGDIKPPIDIPGGGW